MWILYYAGMYLFVLGIRISAIWNQKSRQWLNGRKNWKKSLIKSNLGTGPRIWFHVSSLGEFEQAKPVIEEIKKERPGCEVILSFFSPSGFLQRINYPFATVIYLPADLPGNPKKFLEIIKPEIAVFTKYDIWPGYLKCLLKKNIPTILISANWIPGRLGSWNFPLSQILLKRINKIFFQREEHIGFYQKKGFSNIEAAGDTRIDRSLHLPSEVRERLPVEILSTGNFDIVAGSTWKKDEEILFSAIQALHLKAIIAPHDVSKKNIARLTGSLTIPYTLMSELKHNATNRENVLIVDSIGHLSVLYAAGKIAYVGGGFEMGIHNILEPAAHGKPVIIGPHYKKFPEATDLIKLGAAFSIKSEEELTMQIQELMQSDNFTSAGSIAFEYLIGHRGATDKVSKYIIELIPYRAKA